MNAVLLVDDDIEILETIKEFLMPEYRVITATDSSTALQAIEKESIACAIIDLQLKSEYGLHLAKLFTQIHPAPSILMLSGYVDKKVAMECCELGVKGIIEKPFEIADIKEKVFRAVNEYNLKISIGMDSETIQAGKRQEAGVGGLTLLPHRQSVICSGVEIKLTGTEYSLLSTLMMYRNRWLSREMLVDQVWGNRKVSRNLFDTHFSNLRRKVIPLRDGVQAVRGRGYFLKD